MLRARVKKLALFSLSQRFLLSANQTLLKMIQYEFTKVFYLMRAETVDLL